MSDEIGRELMAADLKPRQLVVIQAPATARSAGENIAMTMWVIEVTQTTVSFYAGLLRRGVINFRRPDDTIVDDRGRRVRVFEYLGEV